MYITFRIQKDKRITLGSRAHIYKNCPYIYDRKSYQIIGEITEMIPKCHLCFVKAGEGKEE